MDIAHTERDSLPSGRYVRQPTGYRAFYPDALPPASAGTVVGELHKLLSEADRALGRLDGSIHTLPNADLFVFMYVRREAVLSSQIEGTQSSLHDVLAAEAKILAVDTPHDVVEVVNYVRAMHHGLNRLKSLPVSTRLIKEIHAELLHGVRGSQLAPGELRTSQNWIGPYGCALSDATFVPPPPHEVPRLLGDLERFLHAESELPMLVRIGMAHVQFETIHPFLDGNGRVGRMLITFLLCEAGVLLKPVLYLSHYFKRHRQQYYDLLQRVRDHGEWDAWLRFFLNGVVEVSKQATETARNVLSLREEDRETITTQFGRTAGNGHRLLDHLYVQPIVSVDTVKRLNGTTYPAANDLVARFVRAGILSEMTGQSRNRRFSYSRYITLFADGAVEGRQNPR